MFSNCPYCGFLVALDEAGQPLSRCPNCAQRLRDDDASSDAVATTTTRANDAGTTTSDTAGHVSEPAPSASTPDPVLEPARDKADAEAVGTRLQTGPAVALPPIALADETALARRDAPPPGVLPDAAPFDAAPERIAPQANADGDADAVQAAAPDTPVSEGRAPADQEAAMPVDAGTAAADTTSPRSTLGAAPDVVPAAAEVQCASSAEADETRPTSSRPATATDAEPVPDSSAEPDGSSTMADDSAAGGADESTKATESIATAAASAAASSPTDIAPPGESSTANVPAPPDGDRPAPPGQLEQEDVAISSAPSTAASPPTADAPTASMSVPPKPVRRKSGATAVPSFARARAGTVAIDRRRLALRWAAIAALALLLLLQLVLSDRARLAGDTRWRVVLTQVCGVLQCTLPAWHEPRAFRVIERDITLRRPGVLRVSARIRNDARWAQPWPALQLTLTDANGRDVATRVFTPSEYLGGAPTQSELGSGQSAALSMEIVEPGPQAVAFTFDFH